MVLVPNTEYPSCSYEPWLNSHDHSEAVPQKVSVISLSVLLSSLEKGQDQDDEKLQEEKMSLPSGSIHPQTPCALTEGECAGEPSAQNV